ncbi:MAG: hypothetical protein CMH97_11740 [Oceanospirillaceae bacterium]|nr:hypothetical protein [Oceanospirillaceae bacterium]|tara:strand:- start:8734 stop:10086 length:1353 start_codon:yes stop_codon:yes gene_type:complete
MFLGVKFVVLLVYLFIGYKWNQKNNTSLALKIVFWVVLLRLMLSSMHEITFLGVVAGQSLISLFSLAFAGLTTLYLLYYKIPIVRSRILWPVKILVIVLIVSGMINSPISAVSEIVKWVLLINLVLLFIISMNENGTKKVFYGLAVCYLYPVILLILSVLLRESKASEADGSTSYIGGAYHEAAFSVVIFSAGAIFLLLATALQKPRVVQAFVILVMLFMLILVNYRTTLLAALAFVAVYSIFKFLSARQLQKSIMIVAILTAIPALPALMSLMSSGSLYERFEEIPVFVEQVGELMVPYDYYYEEDGKFFSGRLMIWNQYITTWSEGTLTEKLLGYGPGSWQDYFTLYAHNTFVSALFEWGVVGLAILLFVFFTVLLRLLKISLHPNGYTAFSILSGFIVLNLATMPLWQIEGMLLFSVLIAVSIYESVPKGGKRTPYINIAAEKSVRL